MQHPNIGLIITVCFVFAAIITLYLIDYFFRYKATVRFIKMEINRSYHLSERKHWERELSAVRWSVIPGLTPDRVKRIRKFLFRKK